MNATRMCQINQSELENLTPVIQKHHFTLSNKSIIFWLPDPCPPSFVELLESSLPAASVATVVARPCSVTMMVFSVARSHHSERRMMMGWKSYPEVYTG